MLNLFEGQLKIKKGYHIYCKVVGTRKYRPYVLMISGGPGFGHIGMKVLGDQIHAVGAKNREAPFNYIYFDPLSCGQSDKAKDPEHDYTMSGFAEVAAQVAEALCAKLRLESMDLRIIGVSFGGINALAIPLQRPKWSLDADSPIQLNQIISIAAPRNYAVTTHAPANVRRQFPNDPRLEEKVVAVEKLVTGNIANMAEYHQVAWAAAGVYSQRAEEIQNGIAGRLMGSHLSLSIRLLGMLSPYVEFCRDSYDALHGCSLEVLTHFFKTKLGGFDVVQEIMSRPDLFESLNLLFIAGDQDHICSPKDSAEVMQRCLPTTSSVIVTNTRHSISRDKGPEESELLNHLLRGSLPSDWNRSFVNRVRLATLVNEQNSRIRELEGAELCREMVGRKWCDFFREESDGSLADDEMEMQNFAAPAKGASS